MIENISPFDIPYKMKIVGLTIVRKTLYILFTFLFIMFVASSVAAIENQKVTVNIDQMTFEESITKLSEIFDIEITLVGVKNLPQNKFNLTLEQATFEQAVREAMRKAGLQNHILAMNQQKNFTRIWILQEVTTDTIGSLMTCKNVMKSMTPEEFKALEPTESENFRMMTQEEYNRLESASNENFRGMTPEEFKALEPAESENFRMMTQEEYNRLESASKENFRGMTPEEFEKLKQDG